MNQQMSVTLPEQEAAVRKCAVEGCKRKYRARGFCWAHRPAIIGINTCKIEGCKRRHEAKGFCSKHYGKWRRTEKLTVPITKEYLKAYGRSLQGRFTALKCAVKNSGGISDITRKDHEKLLDNPCHYCGGKLNPTGHALDRVIPSNGYMLSNVVPCCYTCNKIKGDSLSYDEMLVAMRAVLYFRQYKE